jgi:hypothetical protein
VKQFKGGEKGIKDVGEQVHVLQETKSDPISAVIVWSSSNGQPSAAKREYYINHSQVFTNGNYAYFSDPVEVKGATDDTFSTDKHSLEMQFYKNNLFYKYKGRQLLTSIPVCPLDAKYNSESLACEKCTEPFASAPGI